MKPDYQTELTRLQQIITADTSTDDQREEARAAKKKLINDSVDSPTDNQ